MFAEVKIGETIFEQNTQTHPKPASNALSLPWIDLRYGKQSLRCSLKIQELILQTGTLTEPPQCSFGL